MSRTADGEEGKGTGPRGKGEAVGSVWARRFAGQAREALFDRFNASLEQDIFLADAEIRASAAYAAALGRAGVLTAAEVEAVRLGLDRVRARIMAGEEGLARYEDVHSAVELLLTEEIGETGRKLHTGRSRNEQVTTDERLWLKQKIPEAIEAASAVEAALARLADKHPDALFPGYTHLQPAQVVPFALWAKSYVEPMARGRERLREALGRVDVLPLGSGALAGTTVALDREKLCEDLGFGGLTENAMDAVADRTFILDVLYALAVLMLDAGRLASDLIIYASRDFGLINMDAAIATSSSLMPQKKNPDIFELVRAAAGAAAGRLMEMFMVLKGLPSTYNKDLQADKRPLREGVEEPIEALRVLAAALGHIRPRADVPAAVLDPGLYAADLVDYLVKRGVPFREAHGIVGSIVAWTEKTGTLMDHLPVEDWRRFSPLFDESVWEVFNPRRSIGIRIGGGGQV
ncbi:MAG: argininosuccinate lyase [Acidobacteriota bacterium]|nr:argininosuccinate lyase [Acidobacteriota bacterium]